MNAFAQVAGGTARAIGRRLAASADLLALYARLSSSGARPDTMMFETLAGASIILDRAAVRVECRGGDVTLDALTSGGEAVLRLVARGLSDRLVESCPGRLLLRYRRSMEVDARERLLAESPFDVLRAIKTLLRSETPEEPFTVCLIGVVAFDHVDLFEELPQPAEDPVDFPDFVYWLAESAVIGEPRSAPRLVCTAFSSGLDDETSRSHFSAVNRLSELAHRASGIEPSGPAAAVQEVVEVDVDLDDLAFEALVARLKEHIVAGDAYQIVASRSFRAACTDPLAAFARQRSLDRSPYMFFVSMETCSLFGCSPETSVRVLRQGLTPILEVKPIAGTRPRGASSDEDDRMEADLRLDAKESAEHMMLVDLARNDVARVSEPGTRHVAQLMGLEKYARVMHLVSSVKGVLASDFDAVHALHACLNPGTLSGTPKLKATELIRTYERTRRGPYGGTIGWLNGEGCVDTAIVIRSALVKDAIAYVRAGAGIVLDSDPRSEAEETRRKASAVLSAIAGTRQ
jgi:anthranilate synthase component 1